MRPGEGYHPELLDKKVITAHELDSHIFDGHWGQLAQCPHDIKLAWSAKLGSSVYSSPLILPATAAGGPAAFSNTFLRYAEAVDGVDGHELPGWPYAFSRSGFHASPLAFDVDADGVDELLLLTSDAEVIFLSQAGMPLRDRGFKLPKLKVKKAWYDHADAMHKLPAKMHTHRMADHADGGGGADGAAAAAAAAEQPAAEFGDDIGAHGRLSAEAEASFGLFAPLGEEAQPGGEEGEGDAEGARADALLLPPRLAKWVETYEAPAALRALDSAGYVFVDAHVLASPTLADLDGDGERELVVGVSYYFEEESAARLARLGLPVDGGHFSRAPGVWSYGSATLH